jgi:hypothetical protein
LHRRAPKGKKSLKKNGKEQKAESIILLKIDTPTPSPTSGQEVEPILVPKPEAERRTPPVLGI